MPKLVQNTTMMTLYGQPAFVGFFAPIAGKYKRGSHKRTYASGSRWTARVGSSAPISHVESKSQTFRLAPSDFAFLWEECKRCFYLKAHGQLYRPRAPFPSIFGTIDVAMKRHFQGLRTTTILPDMPPGVFLCEEKDAWVESLPVSVPDHSASVYIRGMIDSMVRFDDGTFGIFDFKTSSAEKTAKTYARQLHAYAAALESPSVGSDLARCEISSLGLVVYTPEKFHTPLDTLGGISSVLTGNLSYVDIPYDPSTFLDFVSSVLDVLTSPNPPDPPPAKSSRSKNFTSCPYCQYLHDAAKHGLIPGHKA